MRAEAIAAALQVRDDQARRRVNDWIKAVNAAQAEYRKIVGEPAPHRSMWVPGEKGEPTVIVEGTLFAYRRDLSTSLHADRLHVADTPIRSLAQLGALILRADCTEETTDG